MSKNEKDKTEKKRKRKKPKEIWTFQKSASIKFMKCVSMESIWQSQLDITRKDAHFFVMMKPTVALSYFLHFITLKHFNCVWNEFFRIYYVFSFFFLCFCFFSFWLESTINRKNVKNSHKFFFFSFSHLFVIWYKMVPFPFSGTLL